MSEKRNIRKILNNVFVLNKYTVILLVILLLMLIVIIVEQRQATAVKDTYPLEQTIQPSNAKEPFEIAKLKAEIQQIRSDTSGSLFWLKLIAVFVTVGGAVGGYLLAQTKTNQERIAFEDRKNVDLVYQSIIQELSNNSPLLRAAAVVKLGAILQSFPSEWIVDEKRQEQLKQLTKQVLAAAMAIEENPKVLKTITIAIALHKTISHKIRNKKTNEEETEMFGDLRDLDLSMVKAKDAYWAKVDFSNSDFFKAKLSQTSFSNSILKGTQFREADLKKAVFRAAVCTEANFNLADLRDADFTGVEELSQVNFEGAKVCGIKLNKDQIKKVNENIKVDISPKGDGSESITIRDWLETMEKPQRN